MREVFLFEIGGCIHRQSARMMRCVVRGAPTREPASMAEATRFALGEIIKFMRPGVTSHEVNTMCGWAPAEAGWGGIHQQRSAYSVGISFPPIWGEGYIMIIQHADPTLPQQAMVFHVIPKLLVEGVPDIGTSDTVLVREDGARALNVFDRKLCLKSTGGVSAWVKRRFLLP